MATPDIEPLVMTTPGMADPRFIGASLKDRYECHKFYHDILPPMQAQLKMLLARRSKPEDAAKDRAHETCGCPYFHREYCALYVTDDYIAYLAEQDTIQVRPLRLQGAVHTVSPSANKLPVTVAYLKHEFALDGGANAISTAVGICPNCDDDVGPDNPLLDVRLLRQCPQHTVFMKELPVSHACFTEALRYELFTMQEVQDKVNADGRKMWRIDDPPTPARLRNTDPLVRYGGFDVYLFRVGYPTKDLEGRPYNYLRGEPAWVTLPAEEIEFVLECKRVFREEMLRRLRARRETRATARERALATPTPLD